MINPELKERWKSWFRLVVFILFFSLQYLKAIDIYAVFIWQRRREVKKKKRIRPLINILWKCTTITLTDISFKIYNRLFTKTNSKTQKNDKQKIFDLFFYTPQSPFIMWHNVCSKCCALRGYWPRQNVQNVTLYVSMHKTQSYSFSFTIWNFKWVQGGDEMTTTATVAKRKYKCYLCTRHFSDFSFKLIFIAIKLMIMIFNFLIRFDAEVHIQMINMKCEFHWISSCINSIYLFFFSLSRNS